MRCDGGPAFTWPTVAVSTASIRRRALEGKQHVTLTGLGDMNVHLLGDSPQSADTRCGLPVCVLARDRAWECRQHLALADPGPIGRAAQAGMAAVTLSCAADAAKLTYLCRSTFQRHRQARILPTAQRATGACGGV